MRVEEQRSQTISESPVFFASDRDNLFGIVTRPREPSRTGVVLLTGGAWIPAINRNRLWVRLARVLAEDGHNVLRFDYHGVGESTGQLTTYGLDPSFRSGIEAAARTLREQGADRVILLGTCFGARLALACASRIPGVAGLILMSPPLGDFEKAGEEQGVGERLSGRSFAAVASALRDPARRAIYLRILRGLIRLKVTRAFRRATLREPLVDSWVGPLFLRGVRQMAEAGVPLLFAFGNDDPYGDQFSSAVNARLGRLLALPRARSKVEYLHGQVHRLLDPAVQDAVVDSAPGWVTWVISEDGER